MKINSIARKNYNHFAEFANIIHLKKISLSTVSQDIAVASILINCKFYCNFAALELFYL